MKDISKHDVMRELQGDVVLARDGKDEILLTIVRVMDEPQHLCLSNRESKPQDRESWPFTQGVADKLKPSKDPRAKWEMKL